MVHFGLVPPGPAPGPLTPMQRKLREERLGRDCQACLSSNLLGGSRIARGIQVADKNCDSPLAQRTSTFFFYAEGQTKWSSALTRRFVDSPIAGPGESRNQVFSVFQ